MKPTINSFFPPPPHKTLEVELLVENTTFRKVVFKLFAPHRINVNGLRISIIKAEPKSNITYDNLLNFICGIPMIITHGKCNQQKRFKLESRNAHTETGTGLGMILTRNMQCVTAELSTRYYFVGEIEPQQSIKFTFKMLA